MKQNLLHFAISAACLASVSQLPASVSAVAVQEPAAFQAFEISPSHPTAEEAKEVANRIHFDGPKKEKRMVNVHAGPDAAEIAERIHFKPLVKRKGGGGGGKGGGGGGGGKSSGGGKTSGGGTSVPKSSRGSRFGYKTYGGRYGGGAVTPYRAGGVSKLGLVPFLIPLALIAVIFPGIWLYEVYSYHYRTMYNYYNETLRENQSVPVQCFCMKYSDCACDDDGDTNYLSEIIALNQKNTTTFNTVDGVWTLLINGTVMNGTGAAEAGDEISAASSLNVIGYIWMVGVACWMAYSM